jgi:hypothetical protein
MRNLEKGSIVPLIVAVVAILVLGGVYYTSKKTGNIANDTSGNVSQNNANQNLVGNDRDAHGCIGSAGYSWSEQEQKCVRPWEENASSSTSTNSSNSQNENEPTPVITSISPTSGPIGTVVEIKGNNLAGFEGDLDAWIQNSKGEVAFLPRIGSVPRADQTIKVKIDSQLCKENNGYSGKPCSSYMTIRPGVYSIYTQPWGKMSNKVQFIVNMVKSISEPVACTMEAKMCPDGSYVGRVGPNCEFASCSSTTKPSIVIISPNGGEKWKIGQTYTISIVITGELGTRTVRLNRYSDDGIRVGEETIGTTETNNFSFKVPVGTPETRGNADRYKIQVISDKYNSGMGVSDESDNYFTITN